MIIVILVVLGAWALGMYLDWKFGTSFPKKKGDF